MLPLVASCSSGSARYFVMPWEASCVISYIPLHVLAGLPYIKQ